MTNFGNPTHRARANEGALTVHDVGRTRLFTETALLRLHTCAFGPRADSTVCPGVLELFHDQRDHCARARASATRDIIIVF